MFQHDGCTIEGLTLKIDSILKKEMPQVLAECDPAFTRWNRLRLSLGEAYYRRGVLLDEECNVRWAIYNFGQAINPFRYKILSTSLPICPMLMSGGHDSMRK